MKLYKLVNIHQTEEMRKEKATDTKLIGYFRTKRECRDVIERLKDKPGFCLPDAFFVIYTVRLKTRDKNISVFYSLDHEWYDGVFDYVTHFGIFETEEEAEKVLEKARNRKKFKDHPDGFGIYEEEIGLIGWSEGFKSWDDD